MKCEGIKILKKQMKICWEAEKSRGFEKLKIFGRRTS